MNKLLWIAAFLFSSVLQAQTHKGISFQGVIKLPNGDFPTRSGMTVKAQILSPNDCILREEQFTAINISDGYIHLAVGTGTPLGYDKGFSMKQVMDNSAVVTGLTCLHTDGTVNSGVTSFNPAVTSGARKLRISLTIDSYPIVADFNMRSMAYAINAESLNGKTESSFINTSANITQSALEAWFASAVLGQLTGGTYNAPTATTAVTAQGLAFSYTVPLSQGGTGATTATGARTNLGLGPLAEMTPTGTASSTTYLRGDGRWETVTGGVSSVATKTGDVTLVAADINDFSTAADARITTQKGANNGIATLDGSGKVPSSQLALTTSDIPGLSASHITAGTFADSMLAGLSIDKLLNGSNKYFNYKPSNTACSDNEVLKYDSTLLSGQGGWKCAPDASGVGVEADPTVQAFAKNAPSTGLKVVSNQVAVDFGTAAGKVVEGNDSRLTGAFASSTTLSGDLSGTLPSPVVEKIKSQSISAAGSLAGQVLRYAGGGTWTPNFISMTDLRSSITGSAALSGTGCSNGQTLTWSSATDTLQCTAISITKSQVSDFPTLATSATTDTTNATNITSGTLNAARLPSSVTDALWTASSGHVSRATGNVGIGTASPVGKLSIEGSGVVGMQIKTTGAGAVDTMNLVNDMDANGYFWFSKGNSAGSSPSSSNRLVGITNEGNVEIYGQQTNGSVDASGVLSLKTQAASDGGTRNEVSMEFYADRSDLNTMSGFVGYENGTSFDLSLMNNKSGKLLFGTAGNSSLSVDSAGNVGVGTTNPTAKLEVAGTVKATELSGPWDHTPSGYIRLGDVQIAWGTTGVIADGGNVSVNFPAAFSALPSVTLSSTSRANYQCTSGWNGTDSRTTTGFKAYAEAGADNKCSWMAIGPWR